MASINGLTTGLLGQLVDQWGALPPLSVQFISSNSGVDLPQPWERLTLDHVRALDTAVQTRPELARAIESAVQFSEKASYGMGRESPLNRYLADEDKALEIFRNLSRDGLNETLWELYQEGALHSLLNDFSSILFWWGNKKKLVRLLTEERLNDLTVPVRAAVVLAMQKGITSRVMEQGIENVLRGTRGADLTRLKGLLDRHSPEDFQKLVYVDIGSWFRRNRIFKHIAAEAAGVKPDIRLLESDIDDTQYRNWMDPRYPDDTVYPGVIAFYKALGRYHENDWERRGPTYISARPGERTGIVESISVETLRKRTGFRYPTVLSSNVFTLIGESIARAKFDNFVSYSRLFPEFTAVLTGDNGQQDPEFCKQAIESYPEIVAGAFIHNVALDVIYDPRGYYHEEVSPPGGTRRIFYYDTYIGAALAAHEMTPSLLSLADLQEVVREALNDVDWIHFDNDDQSRLVHGLLQRDRKIVEAKYGVIPNL